MKYFFLSDSWTTGRVWEFGGLWNETARRRQPHLQKRSLCIHENGEVLWLFQAEDSILMVEAKPKAPACTHTPIGQVVLKRLLSAEQVIERLCEENVFQPHWHQRTDSPNPSSSNQTSSNQTSSNQTSSNQTSPNQTLALNDIRNENPNNQAPAIAQDLKALALGTEQRSQLSPDLLPTDRQL